ncbi:DoxX family protein [Chryseobacterium terrae]|uniref:DoxX protein n=1 Tax=Chryseobacterium terrae TaxID=3163299 RepID=A0ABW8Y7J2_9FLAO
MKSDTIKTIAKYGLGAMLITAGIGHLTFARKEFQAQVPEWVPLEKDDTVIYSGIVEVALGAAIIATPKKYESFVGKIAAGLFTAVFPGNYTQYKERRDAFGLNTDNKRFARLFMQPLLIFWALKSTGK